MSLFGQDLYLSTIDKNGKTTATYHRVWDRSLHTSTRQAQARKEEGVCSVITKEQFKALGGRE